MLNYLGTSVSEQAVIFLYAVALGAILCTVYDVFRIIRIAFGGKITAVFVEDIIFSVIALMLTFIFVVAFNSGELRFFILLGEMIGFTLYYFTLGKLTMSVSKAIISTIKKLLNLLLMPFVKLFGLLKGKIKTKNKKTPKKPAHIAKKHLKIDK